MAVQDCFLPQQLNENEEERLEKEFHSASERSPLPMEHCSVELWETGIGARVGWGSGRVMARMF